MVHWTMNRSFVFKLVKKQSLMGNVIKLLLPEFYHLQDENEENRSNKD